MTPDQLIDAYALSQERAGLSPNTIDKRTRTLRLVTRGPGLSGDREAIERFLDARRLSAKSRAVWLSHLRCFYAWATEEGHLDSDPTAKIRSPKVPRKVPRPIPDQALAKSLANATPVMRCWLLLGAHAGLRCKEIAGLDREDVLVEAGLLRVLGKGGHEGLVPLHPSVLEALELYGMPASGPLFRQAGGPRIKPGDVSHRLGSYLHSLGIASTPHSLRHWFGTKLLQDTHDLRIVQELMRHRSITSTTIYTAFDQGAARSAVASLRAAP